MVELEKYQDILDELGDHSAEVLRASWNEAARVFSPRGLEAYLRGTDGWAPQLAGTRADSAAAPSLCCD